MHNACNRFFENNAFMLQHYTDSHYPAQLQHQKRSPCKRCNRSFSSATALDQHFVDVHLSEQLLSCNTNLGSSSGAADHDDDVAPPILQEPVEVACNDCGKTFKTTDALHQHQWDSAEHTRVSRRRMPNSGSEVRECSQCDKKFSTANDLEQHFVDQHPLSEVPESDEHCTWQHVADRFHLAWKKPSQSLHRIHKIFKVYNPGWRRKAFEEYRKELKKELANKKLAKLGAEEDIHVRNTILHDGNELKRYHGTKVRCELAGQAQLGAIIKGGSSSSSPSLCFDPECSLCRILQSGFKTSKCKMDKFQRFGRGIYCSSISSKADAYVWCSSSRSNHPYGGNIFDSSCKVIMMCKVLAGRLYRSTQNLQGLHSPPLGFHSVQGEPGEVLNYDELVVYDDRAILPEYIILYSTG